MQQARGLTTPGPTQSRTVHSGHKPINQVRLPGRRDHPGYHAGNRQRQKNGHNPLLHANRPPPQHGVSQYTRFPHSIQPVSRKCAAGENPAAGVCRTGAESQLLTMETVKWALWGPFHSKERVAWWLSPSIS